MPWPDRLDRRIGLLMIVLAVFSAVLGGVVSVLLTQQVLRDSVDEQLHTITAHPARTIDEVMQAVPPRSLTIWREGGQDTVRAAYPDPQVTEADRRVLEQALSRGPGLRSLKLPVRDDMRVLVVQRSGRRELVAIDTESNEHELARLIALEGTVWVGCGLAAAVAGIAMTRRLTRPLRDVAQTAEQIARVPVDSVAAAVTRRVADQGQHVAEVDAVVHATNALLHQVEYALRRRDESEEALRSFLADVSHELRTPLAVVRSHAEVGRALIERGGNEQALRQDVLVSLQRMERESDRMGRLVEDLLLLARTDGTSQPQLESVDLTFLALEVMSDAKMLAPTHRWAFTAPEEPVELLGDTDGVRRVVTNLVTNARKHTPPGTRISVGVGQRGGDAWFEVVDDGPGLPEKVASAPGVRFTGRNPHDHTSTGLGLAITRSLVESMGGRTVFTTGSTGTAVTVWLPMVRTRGADAASDEA